MKNLTTILFLLVTLMTFGQAPVPYNPQTIGQPSRNQKVGKGLKVIDTLAVDGKSYLWDSVGIGTNTPDHFLDVHGSVHIVTNDSLYHYTCDSVTLPTVGVTIPFCGTNFGSGDTLSINGNFDLRNAGQPFDRCNGSLYANPTNGLFFGLFLTPRGIAQWSTNGFTYLYDADCPSCVNQGNSVGLFGTGDNTLMGDSAGAFSTANANIGIGSHVLMYDSTGENVAVGNNSQKLNNGGGNVTIGNFSMANCLTCDNNSTLGFGTFEHFQGSNNIAIGNDALEGTIGTSLSFHDAIAIGNSAGFNGLGANSIAIGSQAGYEDSTTEDMLFIGRSNDYIMRGTGGSVDTLALFTDLIVRNNNVLIGSPSVWDSVKTPLTVVQNTGSNIWIGKNNLCGATLTSNFSSQGIFAAGSYKDTLGNWIATCTGSSSMELAGANVAWRLNSGLTYGNSFTPDTALILNSSALYPFSTLDLGTYLNPYDTVYANVLVGSNGVLDSKYTDAGNGASTNTDTLALKTIDGGTLANDGDFITLDAWYGGDGLTAVNVEIRFGDTTIANIVYANAPSSPPDRVSLKLVRSGASSERIIYTFVNGALFVVTTGDVDIQKDLSADQDITFEVTPAAANANTVVFKGWTIQKN